ncbi:hypothetical protein B9Z55_019744 [Caenorhabditis nigoni]|uniref:Uncharacterized protein n=1 Tax=Caenorhabditis nigoni TaxID=1611254 RepID=A0A2G5TJS6_9PELO|nr:hypothetical protein B9Z55_019744 [Caenorhabditis nigoni]
MHESCRFQSQRRHKEEVVLQLPQPKSRSEVLQVSVPMLLLQSTSLLWTLCEQEDKSDDDQPVHNVLQHVGRRRTEDSTGKSYYCQESSPLTPQYSSTNSTSFRTQPKHCSSPPNESDT